MALRALAYRNALIPLTTGIDAPGEGAFAVKSPSGNAIIGGVLNAPSQSNVPASTFTNGDNIVATGLNNTLNIASAVDADIPSVNATVSGIQNVKITASGLIAFDGTDSQLWTGLTSLTTNSNGASGAPSNQVIVVGSSTNVNATLSNSGNDDISVDGGQNVTVRATGQDTNSEIRIGNFTAPTGAVNVSATSGLGAQGQGPITISGGSTVAITTNTANAVNTTAAQAPVTVNGLGLTTAVTVNQRTAAQPSQTQAGVITGSVTINDLGSPNVADTIKTVSLNNFGATIVNSNSLATLNLAGGSINGELAPNGSITLNDNAVVPGSVTSLTINANGGSFGPISGTKANEYTSATLNASGVSVFGNFTATSLVNLTIGGSGQVQFVSNALGGATTTNIDARSNSGGVSLFGILDNATRFRGGVGNDSISIASNTTSIDMGSGIDTVEFTTATIAATGSVNAGLGNADRVVISATNAAIATASAGAQANFADKISGFEALTLTGVTNQTVNLARLDDISDVTQQGANGLILDNFQSGGTLRYTGASTAVGVAVAGAAAGSSDVLNVSLSAPTPFAAGILGVLNVETVNISANAEVMQMQQAYTQTLNTGNSVTTINLQGATSGGFTLTNTDTSVTSFNASGFTGQVTWTTGALAAPSTIRGAAASPNLINASAATGAVTYFGGSNLNDIRTGSGNDTINGGSADDIILGNGGQDVINSGGSSTTPDQITGGTNADLITILGSANAIINQGALDSGVNTATSVQTSLIATSFDRIIGTTNGVQLNLPDTVGPGLTVNVNSQTLAGTDNAINFVTGTFSAGSGTFTFNPAGSDTLATYDTAGLPSVTSFESIVLSNFVVGSQTANSGGLNVITLSSLNV